MTEPLEFPDGPRSELDRVLAQLVENAHEVLATQGRLRSLLKASRVVADELELPVVLRRITEAAVELVGARYGAMGVVAPDGSLEQFIHVGMPDELVEQIGHLPEGHGLLGALIEEQVPIRLENLRDDPRSSGFPAGHPPMGNFLGVPVRVRDEVYGNLYLTERKGGPFTQEDQDLVIALATTAGAAIDHARLFDETLRRQQWSAASAEVTSALLSDQAEDSLAILADHVAALADADLVCVILPVTPERLVIEIARGNGAERYAGVTFEAAGSLSGRALESRQPVLSDGELETTIEPGAPVGPTMALPLTGSGEPTGVLSVSRRVGAPRFTPADLDMAADFAAQATVAIELVRGREDLQRLALLEDRGRIARDLHDHVIQRLFGAGLSLQALSGTIADPATSALIAEQVTALDAAIAEIRTAIFTMTARPTDDRPSLRHRIIDVLGESAGTWAESPRLRFSGAIDLLVPASMSDDLVAVVREGLANVARHAGAASADVAVTVSDGVVVVRISDDGDGIDPERAGAKSGTGNLAGRARSWGGEFSLGPGVESGTVLTWRAPLAAKEGG